METREYLARRHQEVDEMAWDMGDLERNILGMALRRELETELVPGIVAIQAVFHAADAAALGKALPEWLDRVSSVMPAESEFLTEMGRYLDPAGYDLLQGQSEARRAFDAHLWEMAPCVWRGEVP